MRDSSSKFLVNLSLYCIFRGNNATPWQALEAVDQGGDLIDAQKAELAMVAGRGEARAAAIVNSVTTAVGTVAAVVACIPTGITQVVGAVMGVVAGAVAVLAKIFNVPADKYNFLHPKTYYRRACLGLNFPPGSAPTQEGYDYMTYRGRIANNLHDGYAVNPPKPTDPDYVTGRTKGVVAKGVRQKDLIGKKRVWKYWQRSYGPPNLPQEEWDRRSAIVHDVISWIGRKATDKQMKIMDDVLRDDRNNIARRNRGSLWYTSLLYMIQDLHDSCKKVGWEKASRIIAQLGTAKAADIALKYSKRSPMEHVRGYNLALQLGYTDLRECLKAVASIVK